MVIRGGPSGIDIPDPVAVYVYPIMQWVEKRALVLRVNYPGRPRERLAAVWHNWQWFNNYVFGKKEESIPVD